MSTPRGFRVPDRYVEGFRALAQLSDDLYAALVALLNRQPPITNRNALRREARDAVGEGDDLKLDAVLGALLSVERSRAAHAWPLEHVEGGIRGAANVSDDPEVRQQLANRVVECISAPAIAATAKVADLLWANRNRFHTTRVVTEIRPIWLQDPDQEPVGSVIVHDLEISYHHEGETRSFYVALDDDDLDTLATVVHRAKAKTVSLRGFLQKAGLRPADDEGAPDVT
jgi:hypothetical protein